MQLSNDFQELVVGVGVYGCGIESQLESWYRFLIQPDPYESIDDDCEQPRASWSGVDATILQQRHDFLRPDSLVAIIDTLRRERLGDRRALDRRHRRHLFMTTTSSPPLGDVGMRDQRSGQPVVHLVRFETAPRPELRERRLTRRRRRTTGASTTTCATST